MQIDPKTKQWLEYARGHVRPYGGIPAHGNGVQPVASACTDVNGVPNATAIATGIMEWRAVNYSTVKPRPISISAVTKSGLIEWCAQRWVHGDAVQITDSVRRSNDDEPFFADETWTARFDVRTSGDESVRSSVRAQGQMESHFRVLSGEDGTKGATSAVTQTPELHEEALPSSIGEQPALGHSPRSAAGTAGPAIGGRSDPCSVVKTDDLLVFSVALRDIKALNLDAHSVVGPYMRFHQADLNSLRGFVNEIRSIVPIESRWAAYNNILISAASGTGKTELVQAIVEDFRREFVAYQWYYERFDLSRHGAMELEAFLSRIVSRVRTGDFVVGFIDEIDSKEEEAWPLEESLDHFKTWNNDAGKPLLWFAAGSKGNNLDEFIGRFVPRKKGPDFLSRFPRFRLRIPDIDLFDKLVITASRLRLWAFREKKVLEDVDCAALLWFCRGFDARQVDDRIKRAVQSLGPGMRTLYYRDCFLSGESDADDFRDQNAVAFSHVKGRTIRIEGGRAEWFQALAGGITVPIAPIPVPAGP